jgi:hypothetical protein
MDTPNPYFRSGGRILKGFYDENAITEDIMFDMTGKQQLASTMDFSSSLYDTFANRIVVLTLT